MLTRPNGHYKIEHIGRKSFREVCSEKKNISS